MTTIIAGLLAVLGIVAASRQQAVAEARRAEAAKLLALAQLQLDVSPAEALAYATSSLELADTGAARLFALEALAVEHLQLRALALVQLGQLDRGRDRPGQPRAQVLLQARGLLVDPAGQAGDVAATKAA